MSCKKYNKILIPNYNEFISIAKNYGWKDENIIKLGLPKWDIYKEYKSEKNNKSIFFMFTWRNLKEGKKISDYYLNNTINLLCNKRLNKKLQQNNITLFFTFHHRLKGKININNYQCLKKNNNIKRVNSSMIFELSLIL